MIDFNKKLQDIRSKPERERMHYVYGAAGIAMTFVIFIWILSLQVTFHDLRPDPVSSSSIDTITDKLNESLVESDTPSIDDLLESNQEEQEDIKKSQDLSQDELQVLLDQDDSPEKN